MRLFLFFFLGLSICCTACSSEQTGNQTTKPSEISFSCSQMEAISDRVALYIQMTDYKTKIAELAACDTITPEQYQVFQIPENIPFALGRSDSLVGQYVYWQEQQDTLILYRANASIEALNWQELAVVWNGKLMPR